MRSSGEMTGRGRSGSLSDVAEARRALLSDHRLFEFSARPQSLNWFGKDGGAGF
jgi:hypothetical protein